MQTTKKVTAKHIAKINMLMQHTLAHYITTFVTADSDVSAFTMYANDVEHNATALAYFNVSKDVTALHDSIMQQDTLVREYFYSVLKYIESNNLIASDMFCCK